MDDGTSSISPDDLYAQLGSHRRRPSSTFGAMRAPILPPMLDLVGALTWSVLQFDHEQLKHGMIIYDAFYQWCRLQQEIGARTTVPTHSNGAVH
jgi:hypothetical protein